MYTTQPKPQAMQCNQRSVGKTDNIGRHQDAKHLGALMLVGYKDV
jgi:hypothetical protein